MPQKDNIKIFIDENNSKPPLGIYPTIKTLYNHIDESWSNELADFSDFRTSNNQGSR